jgi:hypothetical protein
MFAAARRLSPADFAVAYAGGQQDLGELSTILKRLISQAIGREVIGERVATGYNSL